MWAPSSNTASLSLSYYAFQPLNQSRCYSTEWVNMDAGLYALTHTRSDAPLWCCTCENTGRKMFSAFTACSHKPQYSFPSKPLLWPIRQCVFWQRPGSWCLVVKGQLGINPWSSRIGSVRQYNCNYGHWSRKVSLMRNIYTCHACKKNCIQTFCNPKLQFCSAYSVYRPEKKLWLGITDLNCCIFFLSYSQQGLRLLVLLIVFSPPSVGLWVSV